MAQQAAAAAEVEVEEAPPQQERAERRKPRKNPRYNVVLWNDDDHSYGYVIVMLGELFHHPAEKGYELADAVDKQGRAIVLTTTLEHAELKRDQIHAYGKDDTCAGCKGSMKASVEPAPGD